MDVLFSNTYTNWERFNWDQFCDSLGDKVTRKSWQPSSATIDETASKRIGSSQDVTAVYSRSSKVGPVFSEPIEAHV